MSPLNPLTSNVNLGKDTKRILYRGTPNYTVRGFKAKKTAKIAKL
jgi:hypothetical protein